MDTEAKCHLPAMRPHRWGRTTDPPTTISLDGVCAVNIRGEASVGSGLWCGKNNECNTLEINTKNPTCQMGELSRAYWAVKMEPPHKTLNLIGSSKLVIQGLTENLPKWETRGFIGIAYKKLFRAIAAALQTW